MHRHLLTLLGIVVIAFGILKGGWFLLAAWLGLDFLVLGIAHYRNYHAVFGKRANGTLPAWSALIFLPLLIYISLVWHLMRLASREPAYQAISDKLVVGRRLLPGEFGETFDNYVDLTAEFIEPTSIRRSAAYLCFPILDSSAPAPEALHLVVSRLRPGKTFVHCAQGHGRTGLFALAIMLETSATKSIDEGLTLLRAIRPAIRLSMAQHQCIEKYAELYARGCE